MIGCIYRVSFNGKSYIGQYCKPDPKNRWKRHIREALAGSPFYFHRAINKYGHENFTLEIIRVCPLEHLGALESYYASIYDAYVWDNGYNSVWCSTSFCLGISKSPEHKNKIKEGVIRNWITRKSKV